jgi:outer membrane protein assembly factor BamE (lipoprotein component of BamABCDE complex)
MRRLLLFTTECAFFLALVRAQPGFLIIFLPLLMLATVSPLPRTKWKRAIVRLVLAATAFVVADIGLGVEQPSNLWPSIDTVYAESYSEEAFRNVRVGMTMTEVQALLGEPLRRYSSNGTTRWIYTLDAKCPWGDFAWMDRHVEFTGDRVSKVHAYLARD